MNDTVYYYLGILKYLLERDEVILFELRLNMLIDFLPEFEEIQFLSFSDNSLNICDKDAEFVCFLT